MKSNSARGPFKWSIASGLILLTLTVVWSVQYAMQEWTLVRAHVYDFFIPIVAGYVVEQQGIAHPGMHSPFGIVFFFLASNSYQAIKLAPGWLSLDKIHMLSSLQWIVVIVALFVLLRSLQDKGNRFTLMLLAVLVLIALQPRNFDDSEVRPTWYANYNLHLWTLLILQAANHYCWRRSGPTGRRIIWLGGLEAVILTLSFNYKISFFVAACCMSALPLWYLPGWRARCTYYGVLLVSAVLMTAGLAGSGANYALYFHDLAEAAKAKQVSVAILSLQACAMIGYIAVCGWMEDSTSDFPQVQHPGMNLLRRMSARFGFHAVVGGAFFIAALGDFFAPLWPNVLLAAWVATCDARQDHRGRAFLVATAAMTWMGLLVFRGIISLQMIAAPESVASAQATYVDSVITAGSQQLRLTFDTGLPSFDDLFSSGLFARPTDMGQRMLRYSYLGEGDGSDIYSQMIQEISEEDYPRSTNETADWIREKGGSLRGELVIADLGFINPWPVLTQNRYPDGWLHWVHPGTTISLGQAPEFLATVGKADVVVLPLLKNVVPDEFAFTCVFYLWNLDHGEPFVPQHLAGSNLIFVRQGGRLPVDEPRAVEIDATDVRSTCSARLKNIAAKVE